MFQQVGLGLMAWNVMILTFMLLLFSGAVYSYFATRVYNGVDQQLEDQQTRIERTVSQAANSGGDFAGGLEVIAMSPNSPFDITEGLRTIMLSGQGAYLFSTECAPGTYSGRCPPFSTTVLSRAGILAVLSGSPTDIRTVDHAPFGLQRVLTFAIRNKLGVPLAIFQSSRYAGSEQRSLHELRTMLAMGSAIGIILSGFGSLFLANRALVPIRRAFDRQRQFTADASHELRTPLSLIRANAEMLERHGDRMPEEDGEMVAEIIHETDHLNRLVSDLLTLARADAGQASINPHPVNLDSLITSVHEDLHYLAAAHEIETRLSIDGPVTINGDETRLRQLLLILLDNAVKYTDAGGTIEVSLHRIDNRARLVVADSGIGIPRKDVPHIFERFYRVDRAREHVSGGTGLGLAIARWIVQAHHGTIKVESEVGQGTRFQIDLPALPQPSPARAAAPIDAV